MSTNPEIVELEAIKDRLIILDSWRRDLENMAPFPENADDNEPTLEPPTKKRRYLEEGEENDDMDAQMSF